MDFEAEARKLISKWQLATFDDLIVLFPQALEKAYKQGQEAMREKCLSKAMEIRFSINDEQVPAELGKWVYVEEIKKL